MEKINEQAVAASADSDVLEEFIHSNIDFILSCAGKHSGRFISTSDDEFSIAMYAFYEAVGSYRQGQGDFLPFAAMIIKRRLTDYYRKQSRFKDEHSIAPEVFSGTIDDESADTAQYEVQEKLTGRREPSAADEIEAVNEEFIPYGFSFMDLADCSPKASKTRSQCKEAVTCILKSPILLSSIRDSRTLPVKALSAQSKVSRKTIERHRKYIIAAVIILTGDYPILAEYMKYMKEGGTA